MGRSEALQDDRRIQTTISILLGASDPERLDWLCRRHGLALSDAISGLSWSFAAIARAELTGTATENRHSAERVELHRRAPGTGAPTVQYGTSLSDVTIVDGDTVRSGGVTIGW
jgi:hypothetical protein